ncbi:DedA family protein [bacterium]|nr:DedA family protein [bacterium]
MMTLLLIIVATLVSEDLGAVGAGLFVADGRARFLPALAACLAGILVGNGFLWMLGRCLGRPALRLPVLRWLVRENQLARAESWFHRRGPVVLILCRFLPGTRLPTSLAAGLLGFPWPSFLVWMLLGAAIWTPLLIGLAAWVGEPAFELLRRYQVSAWLVAAGLIAAFWLGRQLARSHARSRKPHRQ